MRKNLGAYTGMTQPYPPYISINAETTGDVTISVRSAGLPYPEIAPYAEITLSPEAFEHLVAELSSSINKTKE